MSITNKIKLWITRSMRERNVIEFWFFCFVGLPIFIGYCDDENNKKTVSYVFCFLRIDKHEIFGAFCHRAFLGQIWCLYYHLSKSLWCMSTQRISHTKLCGFSLGFHFRNIITKTQKNSYLFFWCITSFISGWCTFELRHIALALNRL